MATDLSPMTSREMYEYECENDMLSDIDYGLNHETGEYTVPMLEWDGYYGKHWERFESEEARTECLNRYEGRRERWLIAHREAVKKAAIKKGQEMAAKRKALHDMKNLGGLFPQLSELRNQLASA